jgi:hypothetical protein
MNPGPAPAGPTTIPEATELDLGIGKDRIRTPCHYRINALAGPGGDETAKGAAGGTP